MQSGNVKLTFLLTLNAESVWGGIEIWFVKGGSVGKLIVAPKQLWVKSSVAPSTSFFGHRNECC